MDADIRVAFLADGLGDLETLGTVDDDYDYDLNYVLLPHRGQ